MSENATEIELMDYIKIVWKWKWFIILPTFFLMAITGVCSYRVPLAYRADAIIQPAHYYTQSPGGRLEKFTAVDPSQLAIQISQASYQSRIAEALGTSTNQLPMISAENLRDENRPNYLGATDLIMVSTVSMEEDKGLDVLQTLFEQVRDELDARVEVEERSIQNQIAALQSKIQEREIEIRENENRISLTRLGLNDKVQEERTQENTIIKGDSNIRSKELEIESIKIEQGFLQKKIESNRNKIKISEALLQNLQEEQGLVRQRIKELEEQQSQVLAGKKSEGSALSLLLYANEIQQALQYSNRLARDVSLEQLKQEDLRLSIRDLQRQLKQKENDIRRAQAQIDSLRADIDSIRARIATIRNEREKIKTQITTYGNQNAKIRAAILSLESEIRLLGGQKERVFYTRFVKEPNQVLAPVGSNPLYKVIFVGFISGVFFFILAFFIDYVRAHKSQES
jgi:hypothetical protein